MTTTLTIINRAFRKVGIKAEDEALTADQLAHGLETLNAMMHGWQLYGIAREHTDLTPSETFPLAAKFDEAVTYLLAQKISPDYAVAGVDADQYFRAIQNAYLVIEEAEIASALLSTSSQDRWDVQ